MKHPAADPARDRRSLLFGVLHHALSAAVMASAVLALEHHHGLDWLDAAMLRVLGPSTGIFATGGDGKPLPQLVLIDGATYADTFGLRSPLDREKVAQVVTDLLVAQPKVLVADLQLEPSVGEGIDRPLDRLLRGAAPATRVILPMPAARTDALDATSVAWMRSLCDAGVEFGTAEILSHFGVVVRLDTEPSSLGRLAGGGRAESAGHGLSASSGGAAEIRQGVPCAMARQGIELAAIWRTVDAPADPPRPTEPLAATAVRRIIDRALAWRPNRTRALLQAQRPEVVVLGGSYDDRDTFLTSAGAPAIPGAAVHAAGIASSGAIGSSHRGGWALDILIGTVLGTAFAWAWKAIGGLRWPTHLAGSPLAEHILVAWLRLVAGFGFWIVALALAAGFMWVSAGLLSRGTWLNPGPIVIGMFLDALIARNAPAEHHGGEGQVGLLKAFTQHCPAWPIQAALIGFAVQAYLLHASEH